MNATDYLDAAKKAQGFESDYELAQALHTTTGCLSNYRHGRSVPDAYMMTRLAEMAGLDKLEAIAVAELARSKTKERREHWKGFLNHAASLIVAIVLITIAFQATIASASTYDKLYIMRNRLRAWLDGLKSAAAAPIAHA